MDNFIILQKTEFYKNKLDELTSIDIEAEADKRLAGMKAEVMKEIENEMKVDIEKCSHYLELLNELAEDTGLYIEAEPQETSISEEEDAPIELNEEV